MCSINPARPGAWILLIAALLILGACAEDKPPASESHVSLADSIKASSVPDQESEDAEILLYDGERISTHIHAQRIWKFTFIDSAVARGLSVDFYDADGDIVNHLTADSGIILESRNLMIAIGNVVAISADSDTLYTEELVWHSLTERITSEKYVTIVSKTDTLRGIGLETDRDLHRIKILKQVEGSLSEEGPSGGS